MSLTKQDLAAITQIDMVVTREDAHAIRIEQLENHTGLVPYSLPISRPTWHNKRKQQ